MRRLLTIGALVAGLIGLAGWQAANQAESAAPIGGASGTHAFISTHTGYSIALPANWKVQQGDCAPAAIAASSDRNATLSITTATGSRTVPRITQLQDAIISRVGYPQARPTHVRLQGKGASLLVARGLVETDAGQYATVAVAVASHGNRIYSFAGTIYVTNTAAGKQELQQIASIFNSIAFVNTTSLHVASCPRPRVTPRPTARPVRQPGAQAPTPFPAGGGQPGGGQPGGGQSGSGTAPTVAPQPSAEADATAAPQATSTLPPNGQIPTAVPATATIPGVAPLPTATIPGVAPVPTATISGVAPIPTATTSGAGTPAATFRVPPTAAPPGSSPVPTQGGNATATPGAGGTATPAPSDTPQPYATLQPQTSSSSSCDPDPLVPDPSPAYHLCLAIQTTPSSATLEAQAASNTGCYAHAQYDDAGKEVALTPSGGDRNVVPDNGHFDWTWSLAGYGGEGKHVTAQITCDRDEGLETRQLSVTLP